MLPTVASTNTTRRNASNHFLIEPFSHACRDRSGFPAPARAVSDLPDANETVHHHRFLCGEKPVARNWLLATDHAMLCRRLHDPVARHAGNAAAPQLRRN